VTRTVLQAFAPELVELTARTIAGSRLPWDWSNPPIPGFGGAEMWRETFRVEARWVLAAQATAGYLLGAAFEVDPCPYTFSHTRQWCGYDTCRES
jgi:hypothetical protein